jgi:hypothetical protein
VPELARRGGRKRPIWLFDPSKVQQEAEAIANAGAQLLAACEPGYPTALAAISDAPPVLTVLGRTELLGGQDPTVGIRRCPQCIGGRQAHCPGDRHGFGWTRDHCGIWFGPGNRYISPQRCPENRNNRRCGRGRRRVLPPPGKPRIADRHRHPRGRDQRTAHGKPQAGTSPGAIG